MLAYSLVRYLDEHNKVVWKSFKMGGGKFMVQAFTVQAFTLVYVHIRLVLGKSTPKTSKFVLLECP
jgi:hypothetical protein